VRLTEPELHAYIAGMVDLLDDVGLGLYAIDGEHPGLMATDPTPAYEAWRDAGHHARAAAEAILRIVPRLAGLPDPPGRATGDRAGRPPRGIPRLLVAAAR